VKKVIYELPLKQNFNTMNTFPTLGAAVLYLNGFHYGKHLNRLNFLARTNPDWVMTTAQGMYDHKPIMEHDRPTYATMLGTAIDLRYCEAYNEVH